MPSDESAQLGDEGTREYVLVGCGASKRDEECPAKEMYTSTYFQKKRAYADQNAERWWVLSAKHGAIPPDSEIEPYDVTISDTNISSYRRKTRLALRACDEKWIGGSKLAVLAGKEYIEPLTEVFENLPAPVEFPFSDTEGIGEQLGWLSDETEDAKDPADDPNQSTLEGFA